MKTKQVCRLHKHIWCHNGIREIIQKNIVNKTKSDYQELFNLVKIISPFMLHIFYRLVTSHRVGDIQPLI